MATYQPIASITLGSSASSVEFNSIPQNYRDLVLVYDVGISSTSGSIRIRFNGDSGANYSRVVMLGTGSADNSYNDSGQTAMVVGYSPFERYWGRTQLMDYSATDKYKTALVRTDNVTEQTVAMANRWSDTSAITSIFIYAGIYDYTVGSTFALYGIEA